MAEDVGILAIAVYFPSNYVRAEDLEEHDRAPRGKYTLGLGQQGVAFCTDREDPVSMALTSVYALLTSHDIDPRDVGRLEVGSESNPDRSKSIKSHLMSLFAASGNCDIEGVDCVGACYGSTSALINSANWLCSPWCDGRLAMVVATDVAAYEQGPARPTGGAGAVAMLLGPHAPLVLEPCRSSYMADGSEFCKPVSLFPVVEGQDTVRLYQEALSGCYSSLRAKWEQQQQRQQQDGGHPQSAACCTGRGRESGPVATDCPATSLPSPSASSSVLPPPPSGVEGFVDFAVFHSPLNKLVRKAWGRLHALDYLSSPSTATASTTAAGLGNDGGGSSGGGGSSECTGRGGGGGCKEEREECSGSPLSAEVRAFLDEYAAAMLAANAKADALRRGSSSMLPQPGALSTTTPTAVSAGNGCTQHAAQQQSQGAAAAATAAAGAGADLAAWEKRLDKVMVAATADSYEAHVAPGAAAQRLVGNCYTASLYLGLASLLEARPTELEAGARVMLFAFGSGVASTMLTLRGSPGRPPYTMQAAASKLRIRERLASRTACDPAQFERCIEALDERYRGAAFRQPSAPLEGAVPRGAYYLHSLDGRGRPAYARRMHSSEEALAQLQCCCWPTQR